MLSERVMSVFMSTLSFPSSAMPASLLQCSLLPLTVDEDYTEPEAGVVEMKAYSTRVAPNRELPTVVLHPVPILGDSTKLF